MSRKVCTWIFEPPTHEVYSSWRTYCGQVMSADSENSHDTPVYDLRMPGGVFSNGFKYCPYCGGRIAFTVGAAP